MDVELQYKENKDSLYVNNVLKTSINWNESVANTILNGTNTRQAVEPRKRHLRDEFSVIKKFRNNKSMDVNASFDYLYLPGKLLTLSDSMPQSLNVNTLSSLIITRFRHRVWGMYISYDAQMKYHRDDIEHNDHDKVSYQQAELKLSPSYEHGKKMVCACHAHCLSTFPPIVWLAQRSIRRSFHLTFRWTTNAAATCLCFSTIPTKRAVMVLATACRWPITEATPQGSRAMASCVSSATTTLTVSSSSRIPT